MWWHIQYIALWTAVIHLQSLIIRRPQVQILSPQPCLTADFVRNQRFFVFFRALRKHPGRKTQKQKVVWKGSGIKKMLDVKVLFLISEIKILSILRAAGERGMHQHLHNFRFQQQQWGNVKDHDCHLWGACSEPYADTVRQRLSVGDAGDGDSNGKSTSDYWQAENWTLYA